MHDILIGAKILSKNDEIAQRTREELNERGIFSINLVSSPGSGKTSIVEKTVESLKDRINIAVIEGDIQTDLDSRRLKKYGIPVKQITTGRACHLDALMIRRVLPWLFEQRDVRLLIIENVGNMVCPAEYDLGEFMKVAVMSVTEGDDKPLKYPSIFHASRCLLINKTDLVDHTDFDVERASENALKINPGLRVLETSCVTGEGISKWCGILSEMVDGQVFEHGE
jgi:hydrogenase nickel incorporation protein HypB